MAVQFDPIAKDESLNTTELTPRNVADVLAQELANIATAIGGGGGSGGHTIENSSGTALPQRSNLQFTDGLNATDDSGNDTTVVSGSALTSKADIADVESGSTASRSYSVGELIYVNGNLYKVITSISLGSAFTVGTNIQSTTVSGALGEGDRGSVSVTADGTKTYSQLLNSLFALADFTKLSSKSAIQISLSSTVVMNLVYAVSDGAGHVFSRTIVDGASSNTLVDTVSIKSSGSTWYRSTITTTATYSDRSGNVLGSGLPITLYY